MTTQIENIAGAGVSGIVEGLTFDTKITAEDFKTATDLAISKLQQAQLDFGTASTDSEATKIEKLVGYGLVIAHNACDQAGYTKQDALFEVAEKIDTELQAGSLSFINIVKNWIAVKKAEKAAK